MKKIILILLITSVSFSQEKNNISVEKSIFGVQTGILGFWAHNEFRLSNEIALRSEVGLDLGISANSNDTKTVLIPSFRIEPRWYYNLKKRVEKGRNISKNSGNFLALNLTYNPDWFYIGGEKNVEIISILAIVPKWGIKRTIGKHFTYEAGIGLGGFIVLNDYETDNNIALDLHARLGYTF